jgi:23S rRNA (cytosine1962-C5)-methyltransferase
VQCMAGAVLRLKRGRVRWHPWVFKGDVADVSDVPPGESVSVVDATGNFVGRGFFNPGPTLCCRILTRDDEPLDVGFFERRVQQALARRGGEGAADAAMRLVWSEGDGLGGLVVDRYGPVLVFQALTLGMAQARGTIVAALHRAVGDRPIFVIDDISAARREVFEPLHGWLGAPGPPAIIVQEGAVTFSVTPGAGHKTGLYLDQRDNRLRVAHLASGRAVLDAFSYSGGFACHALRAGAPQALCLESSPEAIAAARENFVRNGVAERAQVVAGNAFDELRRLERERARFGLVVLDPPPFARGRETVEAAARGYKEINLRAMRLLEPGGYLLTFSCSHHVGDEAFEAICREAARDAGRSFRVEATLTQADDHPVLLEVPETRYLNGRLLRLVS